MAYRVMSCILQISVVKKAFPDHFNLLCMLLFQLACSGSGQASTVGCKGACSGSLIFLLDSAIPLQVGCMMMAKLAGGCRAS